MVVPHSLIIELFSQNDENEEKSLKKYLKLHCKSFTDDNKNVRWCPYSNECDYAAERIENSYGASN